MSNYYEEDEGIHFAPTDEELIKDYLIRKLSGEACADFIATKDVYAKEPWSLVDDHTDDPFFLEDVWYYFTPREQISEKKIGRGKNSKRRITGDNDGIDRGSWRQNNKDNIIDETTRKTIGIKQYLTYMPRNSKKQKRGDGGINPVPGSQYSWIMTEYMLSDNMLTEEDKFQKLVLCKIHKSKNPKKKDDDLHESSSSSEQQPTNINETERNREQSGEENMTPPQVDALPMTERVPEEQVEATNDWIGDVLNMLNNTMNGSSFPIEEGGNTPSMDPNLLSHFVPLCSSLSYQRS